MVYLLVLGAAISMSAAQLLLKKGLIAVGQYPQELSQLIPFFVKACTNPFVILSIFFTAVTAFAWILAASRAPLSLIYPFMALSYILVALFSLIIFKEDISLLRWTGIAVICIGIFLVSRS